MNQQDKDFTNNVPFTHELELDCNGNDKQHYKHHRHRNPSPKQKQILWRRQRVHQLLIMGFNSYEICETLKITSRPTITRDIQWLKEQAVNELKHYIQDRLPMEFSRCLENNNLCLKEAWRVVASSEASGDNKTKLQALALIEQTTSHRIDLLTNVPILQESMKYVDQARREIVEKLDKKVNDTGV